MFRHVHAVLHYTRPALMGAGLGLIVVAAMAGGFALTRGAGHQPAAASSPRLTAAASPAAAAANVATWRGHGTAPNQTSDPDLRSPSPSPFAGVQVVATPTPTATPTDGAWVPSCSPVGGSVTLGSVVTCTGPSAGVTWGPVWSSDDGFLNQGAMAGTWTFLAQWPTFASADARISVTWIDGAGYHEQTFLYGIVGTLAFADCRPYAVELSPGTQVRCTFTPGTASTFGGWTATGLDTTSAAANSATFVAAKPGFVTITARWREPGRPQSLSFSYVVRPADGQWYTTDRAGYVLDGRSSGGQFTQIGATWTVPSVRMPPGADQRYGAVAQQSIGIDGHAGQAGIRLATIETVDDYGTHLSAWYTLLPSEAVAVPLVISAGDTITASLRATKLGVPTQTWLLEMVDGTTGQRWSATVQYGASLDLASWLVKASGTPFWISSLADFGQTTFRGLTANGAPPSLARDSAAVMMDPNGQVAAPSVPGPAGSAFNVCFGTELPPSSCAPPSSLTPRPTPTPTATPTAAGAGRP